MSLNYQTIGKRITKLRKELKLTQWQVEETANLGQKYVSNIETGRSKASIDTLIKICHVLGATPNEILLGTSQEDTTDFIQTVQLITTDMDIRKKQFLLDFADLLQAWRF